MSEKTQIVITAKDETKAAIASVTNSLDNLSKTAIGLGPVFGGLTALLSFGAFKGAIEGSIKFAAALDDMAESTGATVENLSALSSVAKVGGHDLASVETGLQKLAKALHSTDEETKGAGKALAALGLNIEDLANMDTAEAMLEVAKAMAKFEDGSSKTAVAIALLGKSGAQLLPFLKDLGEQSELIGKITAEQAAAAENYEKNINRLSSSMSTFGRTAAMEVLPFLENLTNEMVKAKNESGSFAEVFGAGVKTTLETVAVLGLNVAYVFKQVGNELGGLAAQAVSVAKMDFAGAKQIGVMMKEDAAKARADVDAASERILNPIKADAAVTKKLQLDYTVSTPKLPKAGGGVRSQADDAARLIKSLDEQVALAQAAADSTDKLTSAEQNAIKVRYQLDAGTLKATASQRAKINADLDALVALEKAAQKQKEWSDAVDKQTAANVSGYQAMIKQIEAAEREAELFGLNAAQISVVEQARLADAIAIAKQNGATEEQIAVLEKELALRTKLSGALIKKEEKSQAQQDAQNAIKSLDEMGEFAKNAAKNMQSAFADWLFNPFAEGTKGMLQSFGETVQKMIAQAASAQLMSLLFGEMDKSGKLGGLVGSGLDWLKGAFSFANGGIMTSAGPLPLRSYSMGGIANSPQLSLFGEGRTPEAYVPLPDGKRIPVAMQGGAGATNIVVNVNSQTGDPAEIRRSAAAGARSALGLMNGARRYG